MRNVLGLILRSPPGWVRAAYGAALPSMALHFDEGRYWVPKIGYRAARDLLAAVSSTGGYATNLDGSLWLVPANTLRIGAGSGLLVEPTATNLVAGNLINGYDATVTPNAVIGPDGLLSASTVVEDTSNPSSSDAHEAYANSGGGMTVTANTIYTTTAIIAKNTRTKMRVCWSTEGIASGCYVDVDAAAGTIGTVTAFGTGTATSASITPAANGFYKVVLTGKLDASSTAGYAVVMARNAAGTPYYAGGGASGFYLWKLQVELGNFATSIIPTTAAAAARSADAATVQRTGIGRIVYTFSDGTTQTVSGINVATNYAIPTNLDKPIIARLAGYAS